MRARRLVASPCRTILVLLLVHAYLVAPAAGAGLGLDREPPPSGSSWTVRSVSPSKAYLQASETLGVGAGDIIVVSRGREVVARLEVVFVARHSISCRILEGNPKVGDRAELAKEGDAASSVSVASSATPLAPVPLFSSSTNVLVATVLPSSRGARPASVATAVAPAQTPEALSMDEPWARVTGSFTLGMRAFQDDGAFDRGLSEGTARLSLRMEEMGGGSWAMRARLRRRQIRRDREWSARNPKNEDEDRLYELSLTWQPDADGSSVRVGRVGANPFVGIGYLDGVVGEARLSRRFFAGGMAGFDSEIDGFGLETNSEKYGGFLRFRSRPAGPGAFSEVFLAAVRRDFDGEVSREYVALETLVRAREWHFRQRAEVDFNRDWRQELTGKSSQLSNLSLSASYRTSPGTRWVFSYDQFRAYRDADTRLTPEEVFDDALRQGARAGVYFGAGRRMRGSVTVGFRGQSGDRDPTTSIAATLGSTSRHWGWGVDLASYAGDATDGYRVGLRSNRSFGNGHDVGLTLGHSLTSVKATLEDRTDDWARLSARFQLPRRTFVGIDLEELFGDDAEGTHLTVDLGYRF